MSRLQMISRVCSAQRSIFAHQDGFYAVEMSGYKHKTITLAQPVIWASESTMCSIVVSAQGCDSLIHGIIEIIFGVWLADCAAHRQYLSLVVEDMRHDTHDHIRWSEQPRLAWIADHLARRVQFRLAGAVEIRPSRGCRLLAERLHRGYIL